MSSRHFTKVNSPARTCRIIWGVPKQLTLDQADRKRIQAADFLDRIGQPDRAEDFRRMTAQEYAEHRGVALANPTTRRRQIMPAINSDTKADLQDLIDDAIDTLEDAYTPEATREELAQAVGDALDTLRGEDEGDEDEDDDGNGDDLD